MKYTEWKQSGMQKKANPLELGTAALNALSSLGTAGALILIAGAAGTGGIGGYLAAKMTAKGPQDMDTIQKEYENERLSAELGYLTARTRSEQARMQNQTKPKAARIFA